jgi:hypothetical protein
VKKAIISPSRKHMLYFLCREVRRVEGLEGGGGGLMEERTCERAVGEALLLRWFSL